MRFSGGMHDGGRKRPRLWRYHSRAIGERYAGDGEARSNGRSKKGRLVLGIPFNENASWLTGLEFDSPGNFWEIENPPADWPV